MIRVIFFVGRLVFELFYWKDTRNCKKLKFQQAVKPIKIRLQKKKQKYLAIIILSRKYITIAEKFNSVWKKFENST